MPGNGCHPDNKKDNLLITNLRNIVIDGQTGQVVEWPVLVKSDDVDELSTGNPADTKNSQ